MNTTILRQLLAAFALHALWSSASSAQALLPPLAPVLNPANGHYYQTVQFGVPRPLSFEDALLRAESAIHLGIPGHLVTITSQAEQDFLVATFANTRLRQWLWIGASDAAVEGEWRWVSGPEKGRLFWLGKEDGVAYGFHSWGYASGVEPNNARNFVNNYQNENYAAVQIYRPWQRPQSGRHAAWNDVASVGSGLNYQPEGYIVEYSPVPEPTASVLLVVGALIALRKRQIQGAS